MEWGKEILQQIKNKNWNSTRKNTLVSWINTNCGLNMVESGETLMNMVYDVDHVWSMLEQTCYGVNIVKCSSTTEHVQ